MFVDDRQGGEIWVVDGNGPPAVAEHVNGSVSSVAADPAWLYVATSTTLFQYRRSGGSLVGQWTLPPLSGTSTSNQPPVQIVDVNGTVWAFVTESNPVDVYLLDPGTGGLLMITSSLGAVVSASGTLYYEQPDGHLALRRSSGQTTVGPLLSTQPNAQGGGIDHLEGTAGGDLWVEQPAGQGLDSQYKGYDETTLAEKTTLQGTINAAMTDTEIGPLWRTGPQRCQGSTGTCVQRLTTSGSLIDLLAVSPGAALLGPQPVIVGSSGTHLIVERIT